MVQIAPPSHGVFVPTRLIDHPELPSAVLVTWIRLRSLAWNSSSTWSMSLPELAAHLGIHPSRLNKHLAQLQDIAALSWRDAGFGRIILSFPSEPIMLPENHAEVRKSISPAQQNPEMYATPGKTSYFPKRILGYLSFEHEEDPLLIENQEQEPSIPVQSCILPKPITSKPAEHVFVAK